MRLYLRALSYFRQDGRLIVALLAAIGLSTVFGLLTAWPMAILIDSVLAPTAVKPDWIHRLLLSPLPHSRLGQLIGLAVLGLVLKLGQDGLGIVQKLLTNQINYNGLMRIRCDLYKKLQALHLAYHKSQPQGDAIYRLSSDTFGCQTILQVLITTIVAGCTLVAMTCVLVTRQPRLTLLAFSIAPVLAAANIIFGRRLKTRSLECKKIDTEFTTNVQRAMSSIGLVQAFGREADEFQRFEGTIRQTIAAWWRLNWQEVIYQVIVGTTFAVGGAIVFGYGGYLVYRDQFAHPVPNGMTIGDLMIFTAYLGMLWGPLCSLTGFAANIQGGVAGAERVFEVLDRDAAVKDAPDAISLPRRPRSIELQHVTFGYQPGVPVLKDVSVKIDPGQMVAFVGESGVGKSTLLNLLPRFYDPDSGSIRLDGFDSRKVKLKDLRRHVALVLQDSVILPTTIAENIAYGRPHAPKTEIRHAAELAGAASFIEKLPDGYDTVITENGANLSGGQKQRISIARALLTQAPVIVLDEPTSALDPHHERVITDALQRLKGRRTIVLVSHRLSTVLGADQIFMMHDGRIVEQGTHEQLVAMKGHYYEMARQQLALGEAVPARAA